jgi:ribosomal protein S18 acetylase RimI-like enzyme
VSSRQADAITNDIRIRRAAPADLPELGTLGALLMRAHYTFDDKRFMAPGADPETAYASFIEPQLGDPNAAIFVAERDGAVIGYVYAGIEAASFRELRHEAGFIHDLAVAEGSRRTGVAQRLVAAAIGWLNERGIERVMLWTAQPNDAAQRLFARLGFRRTMIEMSRDSDHPTAAGSPPSKQSR